MPGRSYHSSNGCRFGFNRQEKSPEINNRHATSIFWDYNCKVHIEGLLEVKKKSDLIMNNKVEIIGTDISKTNFYKIFTDQAYLFPTGFVNKEWGVYCFIRDYHFFNVEEEEQVSVLKSLHSFYSSNHDQVLYLASGNHNTSLSFKRQFCLY